jgi:hypothetical protein
VAIYTGAKALSRWPINDESTLTKGQAVLTKAAGSFICCASEEDIKYAVSH